MPRSAVVSRLGDFPSGSAQAALAGLCASLVGIGLARFAYTPLVPALIAAGWFTPGQAAYLGAANLAGYLAGALLARPMTARAAPARVLRAMMLLATAAFFACALQLPFAWFFVWRFGAGVAGGAIMVLAAPTVLRQIPAERRGLVGGVIFTGVGLGIAASGSVVPLLLQGGLVQTWCGLGALAAVLTALAWHGWPVERAPAPAVPSDAPPGPKRHARSNKAVRALLLEYGLNAVGLVPHMVFLVDFVARGLGQGLQGGAHYWVIYGIGAMVGPLLAGQVADRVGFGPTLRLAFLVQAGAVALPLFSTDSGALILSSAVIGAFTPGIVPLVLGRVHELLPHDLPAQRAGWERATIGFALFQAIAGYGYAALFAETGGAYHLLFASGAGALGLALIVDSAAALSRARLPTTG